MHLTRSLTRCLVPALLAATAGFAQAQADLPKNAKLLDHSSGALIDAATAKAVLAEGIPAKAWKVYPATKWAYTSQVEGGISQAGTCVVTARVMLLPLSPTLKVPLYRPEKIATTFDSQAGASAEQCRELAKSKLKQALESVVSSLVKT